MGVPDKSERMRFSSTLRKDLYERLQHHSDETDIPISKLLDRAVEAYLGAPRNTGSRQPGQDGKSSGYARIVRKEPSE